MPVCYGLTRGILRAFFAIPCFATVVSATLAFHVFSMAHGAEPVIERQRCIDCHSQPEMALAPIVFDSGEAVPVYLNRARFELSVHGQLACDQCHEEYHPAFQKIFTPSEHRERRFSSRREYGETLQEACIACHMEDKGGSPKKVSDVLHSASAEGSPLCADCHSPHTMQKTIDTRRIHVACARCHESIVRTFQASVHGSALGRPANPDVPTCTTCHFAHQGGGKSPAAQRIRQGRPCMGCHGDVPLMNKYGISTNVVSTYLDDFHGVSKTLAEATPVPMHQDVLICSDCHGYHSVGRTKGGSSLASMQQRLEQSCLKCHPEASAGFSAAWLSHREPSLAHHALVFLVKVGYTVLIPFVITGLCIHILFDLVVLPLRRRHALRSTAGDPSGETHGDVPDADAPDEFIRFTRIQRFEHLIVLTTFVLLLATGLPQRFHDASWAEQFVRFFGGVDQLRYIHRFAGIVLTLTSLAHVARIVIGVAAQRMPMSMVPNRQDFVDTLTMVRYYLGLTDRAPRGDRFTYGEKFEYWGMVLGSIVMIVSGMLLLYPMWWSSWLPGQLFAVARTAHSYEAMMALLTIIVWHMYGARFDTCIFTGRISARKLAHHHPLEYERLMARLRAQRHPTAGPPHARPQSTGAGRRMHVARPVLSQESRR